MPNILATVGWPTPTETVVTVLGIIIGGIVIVLILSKKRK